MSTVNININEDEKIDKIATALNVKARRQIVRLCADRSYTITELAKQLNLSISTTTFHLKLLRDANLVTILPNPTKGNREKIVALGVTAVFLFIAHFQNYENKIHKLDIPIGGYSKFDISMPCGLVDKDGIIISLNEPSVFHSPRKVSAELLYFSKGYVEYAIPTLGFRNRLLESLTFSLELCSECPNYNNDWKSDITFWINGHEVCTYRSPGDFGGRRGKNNPPSWSANSTQYGILKTIRVDNSGAYIDEFRTSPVTIDTLGIADSELMTLRIGNKPDAKYVGGVNIFGKGFGDTDQDIVMQIVYKDPLL